MSIDRKKRNQWLVRLRWVTLISGVIGSVALAGKHVLDLAIEILTLLR